MKAYKIADCSSAQIECKGVSLRVGYRVWGITSDRWRERTNRTPLLSIAIAAPTDQCGQVWRFRLRFGRLTIGYLSRGDAAPNMALYADAGWYPRRAEG